MPGADLTFDQFGEAIRDIAHVQYLLTEPSVLGWGVRRRSIGRISIQFGAEGGSKILHGMSRNDTVLFILQTTNYADGVFFHGDHARPHDVMFVASDCHFTIVTQVRVGWAAIAIPVDLFRDFFPGRSCVFTSRNSIISLDPKELNELIAVMRRAPASPPGSTEVTATDLQMMKTLRSLLGTERPGRLVPDKDTQSTENLMRVALEHVRLRPGEKITVEDLAVELKMNERTLLRGFRRYLKIGVKQYLLVRQLNLVRRAILEDCADAAQVTATMADYGVTEFGRFAARYKELFDETPSETSRKSRPSKSRRFFEPQCLPWPAEYQ